MSARTQPRWLGPSAEEGNAIGESLLISVFITAHDMFSNVLHRLGMDISGMNGITGLATAAALGLGAGVVAVGVASVKAATDYQTQFARISGLTGSTTADLKLYNEQLLKLSPLYDMSASSAAKALYFIISSGHRGQEALDILKYSSMSATASLADQATVADTMTSMMNAYKDANLSAADAANYLTKIETYGKAQLQSFAASLGFTMVTAHASGISIAEASAAVSTLSQVSGNHGIRRISNEFDNLARSLLDINAVAKRAKQQGFNFDAQAFSTMTFIEKLQYLQHTTGALSSSINDETYSMMKNMGATQYQLASMGKLDLHLDKANAAFLKLTGGAAAFIPAAILLSGKASEYNLILDAMHDKTDKVVNAFNNMRNTFGQTLKMLELRLQNILIIIGLQIIPVLTAFGKKLLDVTMVVMNFVQSGQGMEILKQGVLGLAVILSVIVVPAILSAVIAAAPFTIALLAIAAASVLLGRVLMQHPEILQRVQKAFTELWHEAQPIIAQLGTMVHQLGATLTAAFTNPALIHAVKDLWTSLENAKPILSFIATIVGVTLYVAFQLLIGAITTTSNIVAWLTEMLAGTITAVSALITWFQNTEPALTALKAALIAVAAMLIYLRVAAFIQLIPYIIMAIGYLYGMAVAAWTAAIGAFAVEWPIYLVVFAIAALVFGIMELVQHWSQVKAFFENIGQSIGYFITQLANARAGLLKFWQGIQQIFGATARVLGDLLTGNLRDLPAALGVATTGVKNVINGLRDSVVGVFTDQQRKVADQAAIQRDRVKMAALQQKDAVVREALDQEMQAINASVGQRNGILAQLAATKDGATRQVLEQKLAVVNHHIAMQKAAIKSTEHMHAGVVQQMQHLKSDAQKHAEDLRNNVGNAFGGLGKRIGGAFSGIGPSVQHSLDSVGKTLQSGWKNITAKVDGVITFFTTLTPYKIGYMIGHVVGMIVRWGIDMWRHTAEMVRKVVDTVGRLIREAPAKIQQMATELGRRFIQLKTDTQHHATELVTNFITTIGRLIKEAPAKILQMSIQFVSSLGKLKDQAIQKAHDIWQGILTELQKLPGQMGTLASQIIQGLIDGIKKGASKLWDSAKNMGQGLVDGFKHAMDSHSPSRVMHNLGMMVSQGLIDGMQSLDVTAAWLNHTAGISNPLTTPAFASSSAGAQHPITAPHHAGGSGGGGNTYNLTITAVDAKEAAKQFDAMITTHEQNAYRKGRRSGAYAGGLGQRF